MGDVVKERQEAGLQHGKIYTYQVQKCRCDECRAAITEYDRQKRRRPLGEVRNNKRRLTSQGYVMIGNAMEHRLVMEEILGRLLRKGETVHHKNGINADNRPENLELWTNMHPYGQRVTDLVAFAREILAEYGAVVDRLPDA